MDNTVDSIESNDNHTEGEDADPIMDIIDYLVRCAKISFKNAHVDEKEVRTSDKVQLACALFNKSPTEFLTQFGKHLAPNHIEYFENIKSLQRSRSYRECVAHLKSYHSEDNKRKRIRNRRYRALQKLQTDTDYFSDKQMMSRNPLLYEQLIGQFLTDEEIRERDGVDRANLTFLDLILETVDQNEIRETKNEQMLQEDLDSMTIEDQSTKEGNSKKKKQWGDFETVDTTPSFKPEVRKQMMISAPERRLLREEFLQEMYSSFMEGRDDVDYSSIDNDEQLDDLQQLSQDAEDKYFDSETNEVESLEEHMALVDEYGKKTTNDNNDDDPLDVFMTHISNKLNVKTYEFVSITIILLLSRMGLLKAVSY